MSEDLAGDDQSKSHYEVSLTAGQAFVAFVLLLLSLAASFAFGLMIGKGQAAERWVVRKEPAVINEASTLPRKGDGKIVELGVSADDFKSTTKKTSSAATTTTASDTAVLSEGTPATTAPSSYTPGNEPVAAASKPSPTATKPAQPAAAQRPVITPATAQAAAPRPVAPVSGPVEAQLASIGDQKAAEALAAKLINGGFTSAYVDRGTNDKGTVWRVRGKFSSEADAQVALPRLKEFSKDVWIAR